MTTPPNPQPATPSAEALKLANHAITFVEGTIREWLPPNEFAPARDKLALLIDQHTAAAVERSKDQP